MVCSPVAVFYFVVLMNSFVVYADLIVPLILYHQHNTSFGLCEHVGIAADCCIYLVGRDGLSVLAYVQALAVYHIGNLLGTHSSVLFCKAVKYGFFYFHTPKIGVLHAFFQKCLEKNAARNFVVEIMA